MTPEQKAKLARIRRDIRRLTAMIRDAEDQSRRALAEEHRGEVREPGGVVVRADAIAGEIGVPR